MLKPKKSPLQIIRERAKGSKELTQGLTPDTRPNVTTDAARKKFRDIRREQIKQKK